MPATTINDLYGTAPYGEGYYGGVPTINAITYPSPFVDVRGKWGEPDNGRGNFWTLTFR